MFGETKHMGNLTGGGDSISPGYAKCNSSPFASPEKVCRFFMAFQSGMQRLSEQRRRPQVGIKSGHQHLGHLAEPPGAVKMTLGMVKRPYFAENWPKNPRGVSPLAKGKSSSSTVRRWLPRS